MSAPTITSVSADLANLLTAYDTIAPLTAASPPDIYALSVQADQLVSNVDAAVTASAGQLDNFVPPVMAPAIATNVIGLLTSCQNQSALADVRGLVGRIASNIAQAG